MQPVSNAGCIFFRDRRNVPRLGTFFALTAVVPPLVAAFPGIRLNRSERALKEGIIDDIALAVLSANNPIANAYISESQIGGDCLSLFALCGVYKQWPAGAKFTHQT